MCLYLKLMKTIVCCDFRGGRPHNRIDWGGAAETKSQDLLRQLEEEKKKIFQSILKANTQYNVISPIKQIVCTFTEEGGEILLKL